MFFLLLLEYKFMLIGVKICRKVILIVILVFLFEMLI